MTSKYISFLFKSWNYETFLNFSVVEITEGEEYEISFNSGVNKLCLKITLSKDFPKEKPVLKIIPEVIHHWVGSDGQIKSAPGLLNVLIVYLFIFNVI